MKTLKQQLQEKFEAECWQECVKDFLEELKIWLGLKHHKEPTEFVSQDYENIFITELLEELEQ